MKWFDSWNTPLVQVGNFFAIRVKQVFLWAIGMAAIVFAHSNMLHFGEVWNDRIVLICLVLMAMNHSVVEKN